MGGWVHPVGRAVRRSPRQCGGFTLVELLAVVAVMALLMAVLVPYFDRAFEVFHRIRCQKNLNLQAQAMHSGSREDTDIPDGASWVGAVLGRSSAEILHCDKDTRPMSLEAQGATLDDYYILQYHEDTTTRYDCSFLLDILDSGRRGKVNDPQIWAWCPAKGINDPPKGEEWPEQYLPKLQANQAFIGVDNDSAVLITFGGSITIQAWEPPPYSMSGAGHSRHWIMKGRGTPVNPLPHEGGKESAQDADDAEILHLWSKNYLQNDPRSPYAVQGGAQCSYGINSLIRATKWRPGQIMLMDANEIVVNVEGFNKQDIVEDVVMPRHFGKANVASVDGSVRGWTVLDLEAELRKPEDSRWRR